MRRGPQFHRDANRRGCSPFVGPVTAQTKWTFTTGGCGAFIAGGLQPTAACMSVAVTGNLYAIGPDGTQRWAYPAGSPISSSPTLCSNGLLYVGTEDGRLLALNGDDGTLWWALQLGAAIYASPIIAADGTVYVTAADHTLRVPSCLPAFSAGPLRWAHRRRGVTAVETSSPTTVADDGTIFVGSLTGNIYAVNPDGSQQWCYQTSGPILGSPVVGAHGMLYVGSSDARLYAITLTGERQWGCALGQRDKHHTGHRARRHPICRHCQRPGRRRHRRRVCGDGPSRPIT